MQGHTGQVRESLVVPENKMRKLLSVFLCACSIFLYSTPKPHGLCMVSPQACVQESPLHVHVIYAGYWPETVSVLRSSIHLQLKLLLSPSGCSS